MVLLANEAVLYKFGSDGFTIVAIAMDNFTIMSDFDASTEFLEDQVFKHWEITDSGPISWLLGVKITHNLKAQTISLSQQSYIEQILSCFGLEESHATVTPLEPELISLQTLPLYCQPC